MAQSNQEIDDQNVDQTTLNISRGVTRRIYGTIGNRNSVTVHLPEGSRGSFINELPQLTGENLRLYQQEDEPDIDIRVIDPQSPDFVMQLDQLVANMRNFTGEKYVDYLRQFPEANVWVNIDEVETRTMKIDDPGRHRREAYQHALKYGQSMFVFDHQYEFGQLEPYIQERLGNCSIVTVKNKEE